MPTVESYHSNPSAQTQTSGRGFGETIVRVVRRDQPFVMVERATAQDARLSWAARGLLVYLLSLPADWQIKVEHLQQQGGRGRDALRGLLRELQALGYVSGFGRQERGADGRLRPCEVRAYEAPDLNPDFAGDPPPTDSPAPESPAPENPAPDNTSPYKRKSLQRKDSTKHTLTPRASRATPPAARQVEPPAAASAAAGVSVSPSKSLFSFAQRKAHAEAHGLGAGWLQRSRSGEYDELIADARDSSRPAAVEQSLRAAPAPRMAYRAALLHLGSILDVNPGLDIAGAVARLDVGDEDRARLLAYDFTRRRGAADSSPGAGAARPTAAAARAVTQR